MDPNAGMGLEETSAPPSVVSEINLKQNFDQVNLAAEPKQRKFTQSVQAAEGVMPEVKAQLNPAYGPLLVRALTHRAG